MAKINRVVTLVLDSVGIGAMDDCEKFGDVNTVNTLGNISSTVGLDVPNLQELGLGNIAPLKTVAPVSNPKAYYGKMKELSNGKDTMTGHWELMGLTCSEGFKNYVENGFPSELLEEFSRLTGRDVLCNQAGNGMMVIKEFYKEHLQTGAFIVYTSVDSTFQIAAHEDVIPLEELYQACKIARELTRDEKYNVARVIARPFIGEYENFSRTANRHDYALDPHGKTVLDSLKEADLESFAVGKITDIFNGRGVTGHVYNQNNMHGVDNMIEQIKLDYKGQLFVNLVDFDSLYGHPRDVVGYKNALEEFDARIPEILENLRDTDLLIITADHGNDPTYIGNDHTREHVPLLVYSKVATKTNEIPLRNTFEDIGETVCEIFNLDSTPNGTSILNDLKGL